MDRACVSHQGREAQRGKPPVRAGERRGPPGGSLGSHLLLHAQLGAYQALLKVLICVTSRNPCNSPGSVCHCFSHL